MPRLSTCCCLVDSPLLFGNTNLIGPLLCQLVSHSRQIFWKTEYCPTNHLFCYFFESKLGCSWAFPFCEATRFFQVRLCNLPLGLWFACFRWLCRTRAASPLYRVSWWRRPWSPCKRRRDVVRRWPRVWKNNGLFSWNRDEQRTPVRHLLLWLTKSWQDNY